MSLKTRLEKLEAQHQTTASAMPVIVVRFDGPEEDKPPVTRLESGSTGEIFTREPDEAEQNFIDRAAATFDGKAAYLVAVG